MLIIKTITVTPFQQNATVLIDDNKNEAVIIDPGGDIPLIISQITNATLKAIWLTHCHIDHAGGVKQCLKALEPSKPELYFHQEEKWIGDNIKPYASMCGLNENEYDNVPDSYTDLSTLTELNVGDIPFKILNTPGHSPGHISFFTSKREFIYESETEKMTGTEPILIAGDALFKGSIGRTDLPGGNHLQLITSIKTQLLTLPPNTKVFPGHGPSTIIQEEANHNPFLK